LIDDDTLRSGLKKTPKTHTHTQQCQSVQGSV
jgi:hypothetical protein